MVARGTLPSSLPAAAARSSDRPVLARIPGSDRRPGQASKAAGNLATQGRFHGILQACEGPREHLGLATSVCTKGCAGEVHGGSEPHPGVPVRAETAQNRSKPAILRMRGRLIRHVGPGLDTYLKE